jgi:hypothetical protein
LKLSVHFVNPTYANYANSGSYSEEEQIPEWQQRLGITRADPNCINFSDHPDSGDKEFYLHDAIETLEGVWNLPMIGSERSAVEREYQKLTAGPDVSLPNYGALVERDGSFYQLRVLSQPISPTASADVPAETPESRVHSPARSLPTDSVLVVCTSALRDFEASLSKEASFSESEMPGKRAKRIDDSVHTKERRTLLVIIGILAKMLGHDISKPSKTASVIENEAHRMGVNISSRAIQDHLKLVPEALGSRGQVADGTAEGPA